jgi:glycosyltransferase involved in cell wall biosynthesis
VIERVGVVIPAHNEEVLLPACLNSILRAAAAVDVPVRIVVVLDRCTDQSRAVAHRYRVVQAIDVIAGKVGVARAAGTKAVLAWASHSRPEHVWLATTDADTTVPPDWLRRQLELASRGWEVFVGTVGVSDWKDHPPEVADRWRGSYRDIDHHPHVHGANFGCTARAYLDAGGWSPLAVDEDVALLDALRSRRVVRSAVPRVTTSARRDPRARGGFGDTLQELAG